MEKQSQQDIEKNYFESFRKVYQLPSGPVFYGDRPDVIIDGERKIGIEITSLYYKPGNYMTSEQIQSKRREKVVTEAQRLYEQKSSKKIEISFGFNKLYPIQDQKNLINKIVSLAIQIRNCASGQIERYYYKHIHEILSVYLNNQNYIGNTWKSYQVHNVPILENYRLGEIVREKEHNSQNYVKCDAYWLLVVVDFMNRAQDQYITIENLEKVETEVFKRVIVYKTLLGHILESK